MNQLILVTGGARSGKSAFAERYAARLARRTPLGISGAAPPRAVVYVATARAWDDEMVARIARHRAQRPPAWPTVEAPLDLIGACGEVPASGASVVLVDAVDFWVSNRLLEANPVEGEQVDRGAIEVLEGALVAEVAEVAVRCRAREGHLILVSAEAGMGVVPPYPLGRVFRDLLGRVNATLAGVADEVYLMVAGLPVDVKRLSRETLQLIEGP